MVWFAGTVTMQTLDDQGLLLKWQASNASNLTTQGAKYVPADGTYYPTGLTTVGAIAYNTKHVPAAGLPKDWKDLLLPESQRCAQRKGPAQNRGIAGTGQSA
ncbi:MAG TPA: ABC transporter substrate-binding protein [Ktedonobacteraceae bacterium]